MTTMELRPYPVRTPDGDIAEWVATRELAEERTAQLAAGDVGPHETEADDVEEQTPAAPRPSSFAAATGALDAVADKEAQLAAPQSLAEVFRANINTVAAAGLVVLLFGFVVYTYITMPTAPPGQQAILPTVAAVPTVGAAPTKGIDQAALLPRFTNTVVAYFDYTNPATVAPINSGTVYTATARIGMEWIQVNTDAGATVWVHAADATGLPAAALATVKDLAPQPTPIVVQVPVQMPVYQAPASQPAAPAAEQPAAEQQAPIVAPTAMQSLAVQKPHCEIQLPYGSTRVEIDTAQADGCTVTINQPGGGGGASGSWGN